MREAFGIYYGKVTNIDDPDERGRIKCLIPQILGAKTESAWCEPCSIVAYDNGGDFCIPKIDECVWIMFVGGDPNKPVYIGGWWSNNSVPKETYDGLDNYRIISYADCKIVLVNGKIHIETSNNSIVEMQEGKITLETSDGDTEVTIEDKKVSIKGDLYVDGTIYGTQSAFIDMNVVAKNDVFALNNVSAVNTVNAKDVNASNDSTATNFVGENLNVQNAHADHLDVGSINASSINSDSISSYGVNITEHIHEVSTQEGTYYTSTPL